MFTTGIKFSWDSQDFGDIIMVLKMAHFASPPGHDELKSNFLPYHYFYQNFFLLQQIFICKL